MDMPKTAEPPADGSPLGKLLSHRLRGYARREHALSALSTLATHPARYLEVDTRATADGALFLSHGPYVTDRHGRRRRIGSLAACDIPQEIHHRDSIDSGEPSGLVSLDTALQMFRQHALPWQVLCIDIKDFGFEEQHLSLLRRHEMEDRTILFSWIPQTIERLSGMGTRCPLFLCYLDLSVIGWAGHMVSGLLSRTMWPLERFVVIGRERAFDDLRRWRHGYQHALITSGLPPRLAATLRVSGGGVCLPTHLISHRLLNEFRDQGLRTAVFNTRSIEDYRRWASSPYIDIVFNDDAPRIFQELT